jgi:hypothetical protein
MNNDLLNISLNQGKQFKTYQKKIKKSVFRSKRKNLKEGFVTAEQELLVRPPDEGYKRIFQQEQDSANSIKSVNQKELNELNLDYNGNAALAAKEFETEEGIASKFWNAYYQSMDALNAPTETHYQVFSDVEKHINTNNENLHGALMRITDGDGPDVIIEAVGKEIENYFDYEFLEFLRVKQ